MAKGSIAADSGRRSKWTRAKSARFAGEKRAIRGRKGAEMSVFGTTVPPAIGAYRGVAAATDRPEPTVATGSTHSQKIRSIAN